MRLSTTGQRATAAAAVVVLSAAPLWTTSYSQSFLLVVLMHITLAQSWNIVSGYTGYISLGHGLFFGVGAYTFALAMLTFGWPLVPALLLAGLAAVGIASLLAVVFMRVRMRVAYFAMATLGLNEIVRTLVLEAGWLGSSHGITLPPVEDSAWLYYGMLGLAVASTVVVSVVDGSPIGLGLRAVRQDEEAAEVSGVPTFRLKAAVLLVSAFFPGVAGGIIASHWSYIDPYMAFDLVISFDMSVMTVFGGIGTVWGPVLGAALMGGLGEVLWVYVPHLHALTFGALVIAMVIVSPGGMVEILGKLDVMLRQSSVGRAVRGGASYE